MAMLYQNPGIELQLVNCSKVKLLKAGRAIGELLCGGHSEAGRPKDGYKTPGDEIARQTEEKVHF